MSSRPQGGRIPPFHVKLGKARQKNAPEDIKSHLGGALPETRHGARVYGTRGLCSITANPLHQKVLCHRDAGHRTRSQIDVTIGAGPDGYSEIPRCSRRSIVRGS